MLFYFSCFCCCCCCHPLAKQFHLMASYTNSAHFQEKHFHPVSLVFLFLCPKNIYGLSSNSLILNLTLFQQFCPTLFPSILFLYYLYLCVLLSIYGIVNLSVWILFISVSCFLPFSFTFFSLCVCLLTCIAQPHTPFAVEPRVFSLITCYLFYALKETTDSEKVWDHEIPQKVFHFKKENKKLEATVDRNFREWKKVSN